MEGTPKSTPKDTEKSTIKEHTSEILRRLESFSYQFLGITDKPSSGNIFYGYLHPWDCPELVKTIMDKWVDWIDRKLDFLEEEELFSDDFIRLFGERVFTFDEFNLVRGYDLPEETYTSNRVFDYLQIVDKLEKLLFSSKYKNGKEDTENYLEVIKPFILEESPILSDFFFKKKLKVLLPLEARKRHIYHVAKSGWGKSEFIKMVFYDEQQQSQIKKNKSLVLMESGHDLSTQVLRFKLNTGKEKDRLVYLDTNIRKTAKKLFANTKNGEPVVVDILKQDYTFVINPFELEDRTEDNIGYLVQELVNAFFTIMDSSNQKGLSEQMLAVLKSCLIVLIRKGDATLSDLKRFLHDDLNDDLVELGIQDPNPEVSSFFKTYKKDSLLKSTKSSIYFKLQGYLVDTTFRKLIVGKSTINLEEALNSGKVIILNLSKGTMGKNVAPVYGKLIMAYIMGLIRKRDDIQKKFRMDTALFVDEFQNYVNPTVEELLAESRKYAFRAYFAQQTIGQKMSKKVMDIVLGNTAIKIAGKANDDSLNVMAKEMENLVTTNNFNNLKKYQFYIHNSFTDGNPLVMKIHTPDFLVKMDNNKYYMTDNELKETIVYLAKKSGYYNPIEKVEPEESTKLNHKKRKQILRPKFRKEND